MDIYNIIHFCCYLVALAIAVFFAFMVDYTKFIKARNNSDYKLALFVVASIVTFLLGELFYNLITMFAPLS